MKYSINELKKTYENQSNSTMISGFEHYSDYTDYGDKYSDYSENTTTYEDNDPNED